MTTFVDIANRALQVVGTRTTVTGPELDNNTTNEAIQINIAKDNVRRRLLRMAPWDCAMKTMNLAYITSMPGTPENGSASFTRWVPGLPTPPWLYEYQYPVDCLLMCWIIPVAQVSNDFIIPISPVAVSFGPAAVMSGAPIKYAVQTDTFRPATTVSIDAPGTGYVVDEIITLALGPTDQAPIGAPAQVKVNAIGAFGAITSADLVESVPYSVPIQSGSYFNIQAGSIQQGSTSGSGTGAAFSITQLAPTPQRVILTDQPQATAVYVRDVTDMNITDDLFQDAYTKILGATVCMALTGDKKIANDAIQLANMAIIEARAQDASEGLTINDLTPDWIRIRGYNAGGTFAGPGSSFDWGNMWPVFG